MISEKEAKWVEKVSTTLRTKMSAKRKTAMNEKNKNKNSPGNEDRDCSDFRREMRENRNI